VNYIAQWDISNQVWKSLGNKINRGANSNIYAISLDSSNVQLYVGGGFTTVYDNSNTSGLSANRVARWDISNQTWMQLGNTTYNGTNNLIQGLLVDSSNSQVYVGGSFTTVQDVSNTVALSANRVARWDISNQTWRQFGNTTYNGTNNQVYAFSIDSLRGQLYVGGAFATVQDVSNTVGLSANNIAKWNISNQTWAQLGNTTYNGTNSGVNWLTIDTLNSQLYVGGSFTTVKDVSNTVALSAKNVARWDISNQTWRQFGNNAYNGINNTVRALYVDNSYSKVYIGGDFLSINMAATSANNIAEWDISNQTWRQFGNTTYNGTNAAVKALAIDSSNAQLYVGGGFSTVQDVSNTVALSTKNVARWDISNQTWRQFGNTTYNGTNGAVNAFALDGSKAQLSVGGAFTTAQDISNTTALSTKYVANVSV
jgi:citrate lyase gamma subunit